MGDIARFILTVCHVNTHFTFKGQIRIISIATELCLSCTPMFKDFFKTIDILESKAYVYTLEVSALRNSETWYFPFPVTHAQSVYTVTIIFIP